MSDRSPALQELRADAGAVLRFGLVGLAATLVYLGISLMMIDRGAIPQIANLFAFAAGTLASYLGHYFYTYRANRSHLILGTRFCVTTLGLAFACSLLHQIALLAGATAQTAAILVALAYPPVSFLANHLWTFRRGK